MNTEYVFLYIHIRRPYCRYVMNNGTKKRDDENKIKCNNSLNSVQIWMGTETKRMN